ncbi:HAD family hydrolase [Spirochaetota bacterium]
MLHNKKLIIFDCDGVLLDSHDANRAYFNACLDKGGYPPLSDEYREKATYMSIKQLIYEVIKNPDNAENLYQTTRNISYDPFIELLAPKFDFEKVLGKLKKHFHLSVASNRSISLKKIMSRFNLNRFFGFYVSTVDTNPKPAPDMIYKCLEHFNLGKELSIFVGDSISDKEAAKNAGIDYIGIGENNNDLRSVEELLQFI